MLWGLIYLAASAFSLFAVFWLAGKKGGLAKFGFWIIAGAWAILIILGIGI